MSELFRKSALEKLASPEQLDRTIVITPPSFWIALSGGLLIIVGAVLWGIFGRLPINVEASGIYLSGDGTNSVYAEVDGIVTEVQVEKGEQVETGDVIAYVGSGDISNEMKSLSQRIENVNKVTLDSQDDVATEDTKALVDLKTELISLNKTYEQNLKLLNEKQAQLSEKTQTVADAKSKVDAMKNSYYNALGASTDASAQLDYSETQAELSRQQQSYESLSSTYQQAKIEAEQMKSEVSTAESTYLTAVSLSRQAEAQVTQYQTQYSDQQFVLNGLDSAASQEERDREEARLVEIGQYLEKAKTDYTEAAQKAATAQASLGEARSQLSTAESTVQVASRALADCENSLNAAEDAFYSAKAAYETNLATQQSASADQSISGNEYNQALSDYNTEKSLMESLEQTVESLQSETEQAKENVAQQKEKIQTSFNASKSTVISQLQTEIEKYTKNLEKYKIVSTQRGTVQEILISPGSAIANGTQLLKVKQGESYKKEALCYISVSTGKKVVPGMEVMIYPTTVNKQEYGHMTGVVESVSSYVASQSEMQKKLGDDSLVNAFLNNGPVVEVMCSLKEDSSTASGYYWTSKKGAGVEIAEGTMLEANIVTEKKAPITMLIPYLKEKLTNVSEKETSKTDTAVQE